MTDAQARATEAQCYVVNDGSDRDWWCNTHQRRIRLEPPTHCIVGAWRDIASAPKNAGETVLVATERYVTLGFWANGHGLMPETGWYKATTGERIRPTHWLPLPSPPETKSMPDDHLLSGTRDA